MRKIIFIFFIIMVIIFITNCDRRITKPKNYLIKSLTIHPDSIYADNNQNTYANVTASIVDEDGFPVKDVTVKFSTTLGAIDLSITTNNLGLAVAKFDDTGTVGIAKIRAQIDKDEKEITCKIKKPEEYHIDRISANPDIIYSDDGLTYSDIIVVVKNQDGMLATGKDVFFV